MPEVKALVCAAVLGGCVVLAQACTSDASDTRVEERKEAVEVTTEDGIRIIFVDTGANIAIAEIAPVVTESLVDGLVLDGLSAREIFIAISPSDAVLPALLQSERAAMPVFETDLGFRAYDTTGFLANCWNYDPGEWSSFIEGAYTGYDEYAHTENSTFYFYSFSDPSARRYRASMCPVDYVKNGSGPNTFNYQAWRQQTGAGNPWSKLSDVEVQFGYRLVFYDEPGTDGWTWSTIVNNQPDSGCSFVCMPGEHSTSHMWDWN